MESQITFEPKRDLIKDKEKIEHEFHFGILTSYLKQFASTNNFDYSKIDPIVYEINENKRAYEGDGYSLGIFAEYSIAEKKSDVGFISLLINYSTTSFEDKKNNIVLDGIAYSISKKNTFNFIDLNLIYNYQLFESDLSLGLGTGIKYYTKVSEEISPYSYFNKTNIDKISKDLEIENKIKFALIIKADYKFDFILPLTLGASYNYSQEIKLSNNQSYAIDDARLNLAFYIW